MSQSAPMAPQHRRTVVTVIVATLLVLAIVTGTLVAMFYKHLDANLRTGQAIRHLVKKKQHGPQSPLNILVMGIDTRSGAGNAIDSEAGLGGSDTNILLHVSADRRHAYGVSIARDTLVTRPDCTTSTGKRIPGGTLQQWNLAYKYGGPACTAEQLEGVTGVPVDGYLTVDFEGFKAMVDAIDGVRVCLPEDVNDQKHGIVLKAGTRTIKGQEALNYVRERYSTANSDLGRMKRQQAFISSMTNKVVSAGTLTRPDRLVKFANAAASSVTASPGLDTVHDLIKLAEQLKHIDLPHIQFVTAPVMDYPQDPNRLVFAPQTKQLWQRIIADRPLSRSLASGSISAGAPPGTSSSASGSTSSSSTATASGVPSGSTSPSQSSSSGTTDETAKAAAANGLCS